MPVGHNRLYAMPKGEWDLIRSHFPFRISGFAFFGIIQREQMSEIPEQQASEAPALLSLPKPALLGRARADLRSIATAMGQPAYRGNQLAQWLYQRGATSVEDMSDLPKPMRAYLAEKFHVGRPRIATQQEAPDHTTKLLLEMADGQKVETVLLPYADRSSVCVSSQVGCAAGCTFCATATMGFARNLTAGEIVAQVLTASDALTAAPWSQGLAESARRVSHIVFMGMGEPLWNLDNVLAAIHLMNDEMGIGMRGITVSTVGIPDAMRRLADENLQITLALSLHAGTEETRREIVPVGRKYSMEEILGAARYYFDKTGRRVTYEYVLLGGVNDTEPEAAALAALLRKSPAHVNLIPWNPAHSKMAFQPPKPGDIRAFRAILDDAGIPTTQRMERGQGISAACGQLVSEN
jgi:23S rRNA (adenine2503-C2)-methyltransferase